MSRTGNRQVEDRLHGASLRPRPEESRRAPQEPPCPQEHAVGHEERGGLGARRGGGRPAGRQGGTGGRRRRRAARRQVPHPGAVARTTGALPMAMVKKPDAYTGSRLTPAMTTWSTCHRTSAARTAASWAGVPVRLGRAGRVRLVRMSPRRPRRAGADRPPGGVGRLQRRRRPAGSACRRSPARASVASIPTPRRGR